MFGYNFFIKGGQLYLIPNIRSNRNDYRKLLIIGIKYDIMTCDGHDSFTYIGSDKSKADHASSLFMLKARKALGWSFFTTKYYEN